MIRWLSYMGTPLVYQQKGETTVKWKTFSKLWRCYNENNPGNETQECNLIEVFANCSEEEVIFPLITPEIVESQKANSKLKHCLSATQ
jgi:hypothetical protein